jgi:outer membrane lipoprotein-sorting protein
LPRAHTVRWALCLIALGRASTGHAQAAPKSGAEIVQAMHDRYAGKWFKTLTFVQTTTRPNGERDSVATWYESLLLPGRLRIDVGKPSAGNGVLYTHDSTYRMSAGALKSASAGGNPLIPALFDVYVVPVDQTLSDLHDLKIDISKVSESTWDNRPVFVLGAEGAPRLWIDRDRLIVLRQIFAFRDTLFVDAQFKKYRPIGNSWISPECVFYINGKLLQSEEYAEIKADVPLSPALFDPAQWTTAPHWLH